MVVISYYMHGFGSASRFLVFRIRIRLKRNADPKRDYFPTTWLADCIRLLAFEILVSPYLLLCKMLFLVGNQKFFVNLESSPCFPSFVAPPPPQENNQGPSIISDCNHLEMTVSRRLGRCWIRTRNLILNLLSWIGNVAFFINPIDY